MKWLNTFIEGVAAQSEAFKLASERAVVQAKIDSIKRLQDKRIDWITAGLPEDEFDDILAKHKNSIDQNEVQ